MIKLPASTVVNRILPKDKFYRKTAINPRLRQLFRDQIERIVWTHKIAPTTLNITPGTYTEIQVLEISLKAETLDPLVLAHIDTSIPYPILFVLQWGAMTKLAISSKAPQKSNNRLQVIAHFDTDWQKEISLVLKGRSVDEIYKNYLHQIAPQLNLQSHPDLETALADYLSRAKIAKQIMSINRAISREPSLAKKQELVRQRHALEGRLL